MLTSIAPTFVGLDVHKDSITFALLRPGSDVPDQDKIPNTPDAVRKLVRRWKEPAAVRACYEAGPCGYGLQRLLASLGVDCSVIAPALIPRRPGERIKTDRRDARKLARLHRAGELTAIRVPPPEEEAVRDLVRLHEDLGEDVLRARHRLSKFLLRHDRIWPGDRVDEGAPGVDQAAALRDPDAPAHARRARRGARHARGAASADCGRDPRDRRAAAVPRTRRPARRAPRCRALSALTLLVEVGDFTRFASAEDFMAFTGLVPSEDSSGAERHRGHITKTGNSHLRRILVQAAWAYAARPDPRGRRQRQRREGQPADVVALAMASEQRLHRRYWRIVHRGKLPQIAVVAVARELAGAVWALMRERAA